MADEQLIVASAVVIPDQEPTDFKPENPPSPTTLKRPHDNGEEEEEEASHPNGQDNNKRARLSPNPTPIKLSDQYAAKPTTSTTTQSPPPPTRRPSRQQQTTEKTRNRRLFGNLQKTLAGIGQNVAQNVAAKKKEAVEKRAREKMVRMQEEDAESRRRRLDALRLERRREQVGYDGKAMRTRHRSLRCEAGFLRTEKGGGPGLFYLPYDLRPHEAERIRQQRDDVEDLIAREEAEFERHVERETDELLELERRQLREREREEKQRAVKREHSIEMDRDDGERDRDHQHQRRRSRSGSVNVEVNVNVAINVNAVNGGRSHGLDTTQDDKLAIKAEEGDAVDSKGTIMEVDEAADDADDADTKMKVEGVMSEALPVVEGVLGVEETNGQRNEDRKDWEERRHAEEIDMKEAASPQDRGGGDEMVLETEEDTVLF